MNNKALLFKDKPIFGLDIGYGSIKVMQIETMTKKRSVVGYGAITFAPDAIKDGTIVDPEVIAAAAHELFSKQLVGDITTRRVILSLPAAKSFTRNVHLPKLKAKDLNDAISAEIDQYIPMNRTELYVDHTVVREVAGELEHLIVAAPKRVVDSYMQIADILNIEVVGIETTIDASSRLFVQAENSDVPTVLIDFGSTSADLTIYDEGLVVTGTTPSGGDDFTNIIATTLKVSKQEAHIIKTKYGMGVSKKQKEITQGLSPILQQIVKEIRRMIRYYEERATDGRKISQVVTMGGGSNMPGLSEYLTSTLRLPTRTCDPWQNLNFKKLQPPNMAEKAMYVTAAGLALTPPKELFS
jgi:type IV pilus assembly protein PilM